MNIETVAFEQGNPIPAKFTCQGEDVSPELMLKNVPANTKSLYHARLGYAHFDCAKATGLNRS